MRNVFCERIKVKLLLHVDTPIYYGDFVWLSAVLRDPARLALNS